MRLILTIVAASLLATAGSAATQCRDPKTKKFQKCGTPGAVPAA